MEFSIYDASLSRKGSIAPYSVVWREEYIGAGSLQLVANKTPDVISLLQIGRFIGNADSDTLMYIQSLEDKDGQLWAYGCESKYLLFDRIYAGTLTCATIETTLRAAFAASRPFDITALGTLHNLTATNDSQRTYKDLFTLSQEWCSVGGYGFRFRHDKANAKLLYEIYNGITRSNVKFSKDYGNLSEIVRKLSQVGYKNMAYVGGEGEGTARIYVSVGATTATGLDRREMFVDARDLAKESLTDAEYESLLMARGIEKINECAAATEINFDIQASDFGDAYKLGDIITCILREYGLILNIQITGFTRTYESNKNTLALTLGTPVIRRA